MAKCAPPPAGCKFVKVYAKTSDGRCCAKPCHVIDAFGQPCHADSGPGPSPLHTTRPHRPVAGRSLLLDHRAQATAQIRWTGESSWTPVPTHGVRHRTSKDRSDLASLLLNNNNAVCKFADVTPLATSAEWVRRGTDEFISIASFNRFSLDLMRFGAPPELVAAAQKAAMEEIGHAKLSFAVASRLAVDQTMVPEPNLVVPDRLPLSGSVVEMAEHAFKEACLGEFMAAVQAQLELQCVVSVQRKHCAADSSKAECRDLEKMVETLRTVLTEETTHAFLAFETVRWATAKDATAKDAVGIALDDMLASEQSATATAVLRNIVAPWLAGVPVQKVNDNTIAPVLRHAIEGMVRALKLRGVPLSLPTDQ